MEADGFFETLVTFYQITRRHTQEDSKLHIHRRENLKYLCFRVGSVVGLVMNLRVP
jgi:hypothetical protein